MTRAEILDRIHGDLLLDNLVIVGYKPDERDHLMDKLGLSDIGRVCLLEAVIDDFDIDLSDDAAGDYFAAIETIGDLVDFVEKYA